MSHRGGRIVGGAYNLYCEFDLKEHNRTYINYLEVLIEKDGHIVYAVPSHIGKAEELASRKLRVTLDELRDMCPREFYGDYLKWLLILSGAIAVWNDFCVYDKVSPSQVAELKKLKLSGAYKGSIPKIPSKNGNLA